MDIPENDFENVKNPYITYKINLKIKRDNGTVLIVPSYICKHNNHVKPNKGGLVIKNHIT